MLKLNLQVVYEDGQTGEMDEDQLCSYVTGYMPKNIGAQALRIVARWKLNVEGKNLNLQLYPGDKPIMSDHLDRPLLSKENEALLAKFPPNDVAVNESKEVDEEVVFMGNKKEGKGGGNGGASGTGSNPIVID
jgi:hypothetical protein